MRISGKIVFRTGMPVGEVAPATAGNPDFFSQLSRMIEQYDAAASFAGFNRTHHAGRTRTDDGDILGNFSQGH